MKLTIENKTENLAMNRIDLNGKIDFDVATPSNEELTLELAKKIVEMHEKKITGVINITSEPINKYDLLCLMKKIYSIDILINADNDLNCNRSMRSIRKDVSYSVPTHEKMLKDLKQWGERK